MNYKIFNKIPILNKLNKEEALYLLDNFSIEVKEIEKGSEIDNSSFSYIMQGKASIFSNKENSDVLLRYLEKGDIFGVANVFSDEKISKIIAKTKCKILSLSKDAILYLLRLSEDFRICYMEYLSNRIVFLNKKIAYITAESIEKKLATYLNNIKEESFILPISVKDLSKTLNCGRASLYRAFDTLESNNIILRDGLKITILDRNKLLNI